MSNDSLIAVSVSRDDATRFLENAFRNWSHVPRLCNDDLDDVAGALQAFVAKRISSLSSAPQAVTSQSVGREVELIELVKAMAVEAQKAGLDVIHLLHSSSFAALAALAEPASPPPVGEQGAVDSVVFLATTDWSDEAKRSWEEQTGQPADQMPLPDMNERLCKIADAVVPEYRTTDRTYSCSGHHAKRWGAAYQGAFMAITGKSS